MRSPSQVRSWLLVSALLAAAGSLTARPDCEMCSFDERPATIPVGRLVIAGPDEPGERLIIEGTVFEPDGTTPAPETILYFHHTNKDGIYPRRPDADRATFAHWHGYLRGWLRTDADGRYVIDTIRPGSYPSGTDPQHIHVYLRARGRNSAFWTTDFVFRDDPLLKDSYWDHARRADNYPDGFGDAYGGVELTRGDDGIWRGRRDITLAEKAAPVGPDSGPPVGADFPAFDPKHVWGPDKGKKVCPMCAYGKGPGVMAWINGDSPENVKPLMRALDDEIATRGLENFRAFLIDMNAPGFPVEEIDAGLGAWAERQALTGLAVAYIPSPDDPKTAGLARISADGAVHNTVIVYRNRHVFEKFVNFTSDEASLARLRAAIVAAGKTE